MNERNADDLTEELLRICQSHVLPDGSGAVIREPYIPHLPSVWNGTLVLAEAQNLAPPGNEYVRKLRRWSVRKRMCRLQAGCGPGEIGIQPWDDASLKIAVEAAFGADPSCVAVSNAVPWSLVDSGGGNRNPDDGLIAGAKLFWTDMLAVLQPKHIVSAGVVAHNVIGAVSPDVWRGELTILRLPSRNLLSRISGMFDPGDLCRRYPEVDAVLRSRPEYRDLPYHANKVFFACHAVSLAGKMPTE